MFIVIKRVFFRLVPVTPKSRVQQNYPIKITIKSTIPPTTTTTARPTRTSTTTEPEIINRERIPINTEYQTNQPKITNENDDKTKQMQFGFGERQGSDKAVKNEKEDRNSEKISDPAFYILIGAGVSVMILLVTGVLILMFLKNHRQKIIGSNTTSSDRSEQEFELQSSRYDTLNGYHDNGTSATETSAKVKRQCKRGKPTIFESGVG